MKVNKWELIYDFSRGDNHEIVEPSEWQFEKRQIEGFEHVETDVVFEFPERYGGTASNQKPESSKEKDDNMAAFDIRMGQKKAQELHDQLQAQ